MKKLLLFLFSIPTLLIAQIYDDFSDGELLTNPAWFGDHQKFRVNDELQLQLSDSLASVASLGTVLQTFSTMEWRFWIKLGFSPSAGNYARFYLSSNNTDLTSALDGYFLQFGESGSEDAIELFRQEGSDIYSVCRGTNGVINSSFSLRVKVTRDSLGHWDLFSDPGGQGQYLPEASGTDDILPVGPVTGVVCQYTISNADNMYFDEIYAGPLIADTLPPLLTYAATDSDTVLVLLFNEIVDSLTATRVSNYSVDKEIGVPSQADFSTQDPWVVRLHFEFPFEEGENYILSVKDILDPAGNKIETVNRPFSYYFPVENDIVINEIMADPTPSVGLPAYEYLEIFNRTGHYLDLSGWKIHIGSAVSTFSPVTLIPGGYLIISDAAAKDALSPFGQFFELESMVLSNNGQIISLVSDDSDTITTIAYSGDWYGDPDKNDGGWSLEQINPFDLCTGAKNWTASDSPVGGTPGSINSVFNETVYSPGIIGFDMTANNILRLQFDQQMDPASLTDPSNYSIDHGIGVPDKIYIPIHAAQSAELYFNYPFTAGVPFHLTVKHTLINCMGIFMDSDTTLLFGIGEEPEKSDILINEILFNPLGDGADYVELYNRSEKLIDISNLWLGSGRISPPNPIDTSFYPVSEIQYFLEPDKYLLLTSSIEKIMDQYVTPNPEALYQFQPFPAYSNEHGICLLRVGEEKILDAFEYHESMHFPLLAHLDGVALERISFDNPTQDMRNWSSASEHSGFGTPGYENSQFLKTVVLGDPVTIYPEIFSPDNDGYQDIQGIRYTFDKPGNLLTVEVYNTQGTLVRHLVNNEYAGTSGIFTWDGLQDNRSRCPLGIYIYRIRVLDIEGNVHYFKKTGVLATKL